jgi:hypothetical protein
MFNKYSIILLVVISISILSIIPTSSATQSPTRSFNADYRIEINGYVLFNYMGYQRNTTIIEYGSLSAYLVMGNDNAFLKLKVKEVNATMYSNGTTTTTHISPSTSSEEEQYSLTLNYTTLNKYFQDTLTGVLLVGGSSSGVVDYSKLSINMSLIGTTRYKGLPAYIVKYHASLLPIYATINNYNYTIDCTQYLYTGNLLPLHGVLTIWKNSTEYTQFVKYTYTLENSDLPTYALYKIVNAGKAYLLIGGLKESKITITGRSGESILSVENKGSDPGYLLLIMKTSSGSNNTNYKVYTIQPNLSKKINLGFTLERDVKESISTTSGVEGFSSYLLLAIILIAVIGSVSVIIIIIYRIHSRITRIHVEASK